MLGFTELSIERKKRPVGLYDNLKKFIKVKRGSKCGWRGGCDAPPPTLPSTGLIVNATESHGEMVTCLSVCVCARVRPVCTHIGACTWGGAG